MSEVKEILDLFSNDNSFDEEIDILYDELEAMEFILDSLEGIKEELTEKKSYCPRGTRIDHRSGTCRNTVEVMKDRFKRLSARLEKTSDNKKLASDRKQRAMSTLSKWAQRAQVALSKAHAAEKKRKSRKKK